MGMKRTSTAAGMVTVGCLLVVIGVACFSVPLAVILAGVALILFGLLGIEVEPVRRAGQ
jgi:hypothetical protein